MLARTATVTTGSAAISGSAIAQDAGRDFQVAGGILEGDGPDRLVLGAGAFNVIPNDDEDEVDNDDTAAEGRIEYRYGGKFYGIGPLIGVMANTDGGVFGYASLYADLRYGNWVLTPMAGLGGYAENDSKDIGGVFQFQLAVEGSYQLADGSRLGLRLSHISNAGIQDDNPGVESALLIYSIPLDY